MSGLFVVGGFAVFWAFLICMACLSVNRRNREHDRDLSQRSGLHNLGGSYPDSSGHGHPIQSGGGGLGNERLARISANADELEASLRALKALRKHAPKRSADIERGEYCVEASEL